MPDAKEKPTFKMKVSLRDRAIMLVLFLVGAVFILRPIIAFQNFSRGNFFLDNGFEKKAISQYQRAILLNPGFPEVYGWLGFAYKRNKQIDKAIEIYKKALKVDPRDKQVCFELGVIYLQRKDLKAAISYFEKAVELDPLDPAAQNMLAVSYQKSNQKEKAIAIWKAILEKNPQFGPAKRHLEKLKAEN